MGILAGGALLFRLVFLSAPRVLTGDEGHYAESLFRFLHGSFLEGVSDYWSFCIPSRRFPSARSRATRRRGFGSSPPSRERRSSFPSFADRAQALGRPRRRLRGPLRRPAPEPHLLFDRRDHRVALLASRSCAPCYLFLRGIDGGGVRRVRRARERCSASRASRAPRRSRFSSLFALFAAARATGRRDRRCARGGADAAPIAMAVLFAVDADSLCSSCFARRPGEWTGGSKAAVNLSSPVIWQDDLAREEYVYSLNDEGTARRIDDLAARERAADLLAAEGRDRVAISSPKLGAGVGLAPAPLREPVPARSSCRSGLIGRRWRREDRGAESLLLALGALPVRLLFAVPRRAQVPRAVPPVYLALGRRRMRGASRLVRRPRLPEARGRRRARGARVPEPRAVHGPPLRRHGEIAAARMEGDRALDRRERISRAAHTRAVRLLRSATTRGIPTATFIPWTDAAGLVRYARHHRYELPRRRRRVFPRGETDAPLDPRRSASGAAKRSTNSRAEAAGEILVYRIEAVLLIRPRTNFRAPNPPFRRRLVLSDPSRLFPEISRCCE